MSHKFPPWTGGGVGGILPPNPPVVGARRTIKMNDLSAYLGNAGSENTRLANAVSWRANHLQFYGMTSVFDSPSALASFIRKARVVYGVQYIGCIFVNANFSNAGMQECYDYNVSRADPLERVDDFNAENEFWFGERTKFKIATLSIPFTYTITIDGTPYSYTSGGGDSKQDIRDALYALLPFTPSGSISPGEKEKIGTDTIEVWASSVNSPYTHSTSANITTTVKNLTRAEWMVQMQWVKNLLVAGGQGWTTSAYVQNYSGSQRWGATEAALMIQSIDVYESTNYIPTPGNPDPDRSIESQLYLLANALAANPSLKPKQYFQPIISAEDDYSHTSLDARGIHDYEVDWQTLYNAYGAAAPYGNAAKMELLGTNYFAYDRLLLPPAIVY